MRARVLALLLLLLAVAGEAAQRYPVWEEAAKTNTATATAATNSSSWPTPTVTTSGYWLNPGNHRFAVSVNASALSGSAAHSTVSVTLPWRRLDMADVSKRDIMVFSTTTTSSSSSSDPLPCQLDKTQSSPTSGVVRFQATAPGLYLIYFLPFTTCEYAGGSCRYDAQATPLPMTHCASADWYPAGTIPAAPSSVERQARTAFDAFNPMALPMSDAESAAFFSNSNTNNVHNNNNNIHAGGAEAVPQLVTEPRTNPVRLLDHLPVAWLARPAATRTRFEGVARPGENFTFQVVVAAPATGPSYQVSVAASPAPLIPSPSSPAALVCMNNAGFDFWGRPLPESPLVLEAGRVLPLWMSVAVPADAAPGNYSGRVEVQLLAANSSTPRVLAAEIQLQVAGAVIPHGGDDETARGTRLVWFNSRAGLDEPSIPAPYTPLTASVGAGSPMPSPQTPLQQLHMAMLGKKVTIGSNGLLANVTTVSVPGSQMAMRPSTQVLASPVALEVRVGASGSPASSFVLAAIDNWSLDASAAQGFLTNWTATGSGKAGPATVTVAVAGSMDATGYADFVVNVTLGGDAAAGQAVDVRLVVPHNPDRAILAMGLGRHGGFIDNVVDSSSGVEQFDWLVFDLSATPPAVDGFSIFAAGDGIHDPATMVLQSSDSGSLEGPWTTRANFTGASKVTGRQAFPSFPAVTARFWRWIILTRSASPNCAGALFCQAYVAEVEFHNATSAAWIHNAGTANSSIVVASSGYADPENLPFKAVDGKYTFSEYGDGWDAAQAAPPDPPPTPGAGAADWKWDGRNGNNAVWVGCTSGGLRTYPKGEDPLWQAGVPYDSNAAPAAPVAWRNGGITLFKNGSVVVYSGQVAPPANEPLVLRFSQLVTPVRPVNMSRHFDLRWAQLGGEANYSALAAQGATVVNMHQGNIVNPWINYPYLTNSRIGAVADACRSLGMSFSLYNTMRELSNHCMEIWAMRAFGETFVTPAANASEPPAADWLNDHVRTAFLPAWSSQPFPNITLDAAIKVVALSRWNNYYVAGLRQNMRDFGTGIYLDEIAYDRVTLLRARRMLGSTGLVDHHSDSGAFTVSPSANYMELYPFIDRLWYGEGFNYGAATHDYWLVELSGLPYGLTSDMLRYSGMHAYSYRGMSVGSANRWQSSLPTLGGGVAAGGGDGDDPFDPTGLWAFWEATGIRTATMFGWWLGVEEGPQALPVRCQGAPAEVVATAFVRPGQSTVIVVASFMPGPNSAAEGSLDWDDTLTLTLAYDWNVLGLDAGRAQLRVPAIANIQADGGVMAPNATITIQSQQGLLLVLEEKN